MSQEVYVCHTGTDTWFSLTDTTFLIGENSLQKIFDEHPEARESFDSGYLAEFCEDAGYEVDGQLSELILTLAKSYYEADGEIEVSIKYKQPSNV